MNNQKYTVLVTGGAGFIGSNFIRRIIRNRPNAQVINLDCLTYAGNLNNLRDLAANRRYSFIRGDIREQSVVATAMKKCDCVVHFAAESHVDRSISDSSEFVSTNVLGTQNILEHARQLGIRMVHVSTDEVYGSLPLDAPELKFRENSAIEPNSPYAASKASADLLVRAYHETHGLDVMTTRCSNNFGPYQFPEKLIPFFVSRLADGLNVPVYGDGQNVRDWIHVEDHCEAVLAVLERGTAGETYNVGANNELTNIELTTAILEYLGLDSSRITYVKDRLGHDRRYAIDSSKIERELGWVAKRSKGPEALRKTIQWYLDNEAWLDELKTRQQSKSA